LNCLKISPCWGWLNSNETIRDLATKHANMLNDVYREIIKENYKFKNFDYDFYEVPVAEFMKKIID
jgi:acyloxyacyl hydrolase